MALVFLNIFLCFMTAAASADSAGASLCDVGDASAACQSGDVEIREEQESTSLKVEMLQAHANKVASASMSTDAADPSSKASASVIEPPAKAIGAEKASEQEDYENISARLVSKDHNGNVCMLCGKPLAERVDREYTEFRTDCGGMSSDTGPNSSTLAMPVAKLLETSKDGVVKNGFCQLNFAKSCVDAVANKDYLYWPKSLDLVAGSPENAAWDGRYCRMNGFLEPSLVALQHDFEGTQAKAAELCKTKYAKYNLDNITFEHMMTAARYDDATAPTEKEAELLAAWNCAMGDLGCDMALCAYSFCEKDSGTGLYSECEGWDPVKGMPVAKRM